MINMTALNELLAAQGITPRIERLDLWADLERMMGVDVDWPPTPNKGEQMLAIDTDENGAPVAVFIPRVV